MTERGATELARQIGGRIAEAPGVVGVSLGGSVARGTADAESDLDLGVYYRRGLPLDVDALRRIAADLDDRSAVELTVVGGWGPRIDGGGWLLVGGRRVDWLYREVEGVAAVIEEVRAGRSVPVHQPGHPWGWQPQILAGEAAYGISIADPEGELERLRSLALPYPRALRDAKVAALWEADFALDGAAKSALRADPVIVAACLSRVAATVVDVAFAAVGRYLVNEKQASQMATLGPPWPDVWRGLSTLAGRLGNDRATLVRSVSAARDVLGVARAAVLPASQA